METSGSADLFGHTVSVHAGGLVMSSSRSSMPWSKTPSQRSSSVAALSLDADERPAMTTAKDAYPFEFVWIACAQHPGERVMARHGVLPAAGLVGVVKLVNAI